MIKKKKLPLMTASFVLSEWPDSNGRPLAPHARMLADCTTPRFLSAKIILIFESQNLRTSKPQNFSEILIKWVAELVEAPNMEPSTGSGINHPEFLIP